MRRHLSLQQSEREVFDWIPVRVAELVCALSDAERGRPLQALAGGLKAADWRFRVRCAVILGRVGGPRSTAILHEAIATEKDPVALGRFIHAASWRAAPGFLEILKGRIDDPAWPVRAAVVRELARLRRKESVDLLIVRLAKEDGRLIDDLVRALQALTGKRIGADGDLWRDRGLARATRRNKRAARLFVDGLDPVGSTNIFDALAKSLEIAAARGEGKSPGADTVFFLTDGRPTSGQIVDANQILAEISARNRMLGVIIHASGVAREQNAAFLFNLAKRNHSEYASHQ